MYEFPASLKSQAMLILDDAKERGLRITAAESCTGGLLAALFTEFAGSSAVFERGFVTYSNKSKSDMLGVPGDMIADYGAVSQPVAIAMAEGALEQSRANISLSITGIAGPGGGTPLKPVGTVHLASARENFAMAHIQLSLGDIGRSAIRLKTLEAALDLIQTRLT